MGVLQLAGVDAFWKFQDLAFAEQSAMAEEPFERWAVSAGVSDLAAFRAGMATHQWVDPVDADIRDGKALHVKGTPAFFVNGVKINGAQSLETFEKTIDAEFAKAGDRIALGASLDRLYAEMTRDNRAAALEKEKRRCSRSTATSCASSGATSRCRSTRRPSPRRRQRSRSEPSTAIPPSGRCTTSSSTRRRTSRPRSSCA